MRQYEKGMMVRSIAGHDHVKLYVIVDMQDEYLCLVDGSIRKLCNPKKKRMKHVQQINRVETDLIQKKESNTLMDEHVKRAIKLYETSMKQD